MNDSDADGNEMTGRLALSPGDDSFALDDAVLDGRFDAIDGVSAPDGYRAIATLVAAVRSSDTTTGLAAEVDVMAMFRRAHVAPVAGGRFPMTRRLRSVKMLIAAGALTVGAATAAAAAGTLPGAAQDTAANMLAKIGVNVPGPNNHSDHHPDTRGKAEDHSPATTSPTHDTVMSAALPGKGSDISGLATDSATSGLEKGNAVSTEASNGKSRAGTNSAPSSLPAGPPSSIPRHGPPSSLPAGPPSSVPRHGPPSSLPGHGPPSSLPAGPPSSAPRHGPPSSLPRHAPPSVPTGPPSSLPPHAPTSVPAGPPSSVPGRP